MTTFTSQGRSGVVHKARIYYANAWAETACGQSIEYTDPGLDAYGEWTDEYCQWLTEQTEQTLALCSHCRDREPAWDRRRRLARLRRRRQGAR